MKRLLKQEKRCMRRLTKNGVSLVCLALMFALMVGMLLGASGGTIAISSKASAETVQTDSPPPEPSGGLSSGGSGSQPEGEAPLIEEETPEEEVPEEEVPEEEVPEEETPEEEVPEEEIPEEEVPEEEVPEEETPEEEVPEETPEKEEDDALPEEELLPSGPAPGSGNSGSTGEPTEVLESEGEPDPEGELPEEQPEGEQTEQQPEGEPEGEPGDEIPEEEQSGGLTEDLLPSGLAPDGGDGADGGGISAEPMSAGLSNGPMMMSALGAEEPMLMGALDEPIGSGDVVEAYAIPAGKAYIKEIGADISYANDATNNAITNALKDALTYIKSL